MPTQKSTWTAVVAAGIGASVFCTTLVAARHSDYQSRTQDVKAARAALPELAKNDTLSPLFHAVSQVVRPAVVEVAVAERVKLLQGAENSLRNFFGHLFGGQDTSQQIVYGLGSGIIVDADHGYILTNWHVVHGADLVEVVLADGRHFKTDWVRTDELTDLAVVKIDAPDLISVPLGDSDKVVVGDWVLAVGAPEALPQTVTAGIISARGRTLMHDYESFIQTDAAINPGNSGGPLTSMKGEVIGINTAIVSPERLNSGLGLAIPSNTAKFVMTQLIEKGKVVRGYLGVEIQDIGPKLAASFDLPTTEGALVTVVVPDGPAAKAGIEPEDFITSVDGKPISDSSALRRAVTGLSPGTKVPFELYRKGKKMTVEVPIETLPAKRPTVSPAPQQATGFDRFGLSVETLTPDLAGKYGYPSSLHGVFIEAIQPDSEAAFAGLMPHMVILQIQGRTVTSSEQANAILSGLQPSEGVRLLVTDPSGARVYVFVQVH